MSDTLNCSDCIKKPQKRTPIENDITILEARQDFNRTNIFKWFLLILAIICISCVAICFLYNFFTNAKMQKFIIDQIVNNIVFIGLSILAILKINLPSSHK